MKRRYETARLHNLELLIAEAGSASALARFANTSDTYLSQIRNQLATAKGTPRGVGDKLAAKLESAMGKPNDGWMDEFHEVATDPQAVYDNEADLEHSAWPLISWVQAAEWTEIAGDFSLEDAEDVWPCPIQCGRNTFVLRVHGESMEPKFQRGDLIFVDPQIAAVSGCYVVVRLENSHEATFKQLIVEDGRQYLKALNPDWPRRTIRLNSKATICGVVVFKGQRV